MSLPESMSVDDVARWLAGELSQRGWYVADPFIRDVFRRKAAAVRALVEAKVRDAVELARETTHAGYAPAYSENEIVRRVMES